MQFMHVKSIRMRCFNHIKIVYQALNVMVFMWMEHDIILPLIQPPLQIILISHSDIIGQDQWTLETGETQDIEREIGEVGTVRLFPQHKVREEFRQTV